MGLPRKKILISLHGIRTRGEWQKELCPLVSEKGWKYYPLDYGSFRALQLLFPFFHKKKIRWFRNKYNTIMSENPDSVPSIIVHSFGSLILAKTLLLCEDVRFDRVILTGSIIRRDYDWAKTARRKQVSFVRNIVGKRDFWSTVAGKLPWTGAGDSGARGFIPESKPAFVEDITYKNFTHSDAHFPDVFKARVIPFLEDTSIKSNAPKANYLTHVDPFRAACWTAVMYTRQYIERYYRSVDTNDFYFRSDDSPPNYERMKSPPKGLIVVIPDGPSSASSRGRDDFENEFSLRRIVFSSKARGASLSDDGYIYDIPSALESFNVYSESTGNHSSAREALDSFAEIMRDAISMKYEGYSNPPQVKTLTQLREEKEKRNVQLQQTDTGLP